MFISMYDILNEYVITPSWGDMSVSSMMKLFGVIGMLLSLLAGRKQSYRYKALANYRINNMYCVDHTHGCNYEYYTYYNI